MIDGRTHQHSDGFFVSSNDRLTPNRVADRMGELAQRTEKEIDYLS